MNTRYNQRSSVRILVLGASGLLGSRIFEFLYDRCDVVGTYFTRPVPGCIKCDIQNLAEIEYIINSFEPEIIIHAAGMTLPNLCDENKNAAHKINVDSVRFLGKVSGSKKIILFSTDYVFDGKRGNYTEDDIPHPINHYGKTKYEAEQVLLALKPKSAIVRVAGLFGTSRWNNEFIDNLIFKPEIYASIDHISSYTFIDDICLLLHQLRTYCGVLHLIGPDSFSRFCFARLACDVLGIDVNVIPIPGSVAYPIVPRPINSSLKSSRLSTSMTSTMSALVRIRKNIKRNDQEELG